jgi:16S rRNA U1498 N3-methylase RsmE
MAAAGVARVSLGGLVLRTETAAVVGPALVLHRLGVL